MPLPTNAKARKDVPIFRGVLMYFPDAIAAVAELSRIGNEQHNPGEPLHWSRGKSTDQADALIRHQMEAGDTDTDGVRHSAKVAWRALAQLQLEIENDEGFNDMVVLDEFYKLDAPVKMDCVDEDPKMTNADQLITEQKQRNSEAFAGADFAQGPDTYVMTATEWDLRKSAERTLHLADVARDASAKSAYGEVAYLDAKDGNHWLLTTQDEDRFRDWNNECDFHGWERITRKAWYELKCEAEKGTATEYREIMRPRAPVTIPGHVIDLLKEVFGSDISIVSMT